MDLKCAGCQQKIPNRQFLTCCLCSNAYDIECANVSIQRFLNTMTGEHRKTWKCPGCLSRTPKTGNTDKPINSKYNDQLNQKKVISEGNNITTRKKLTDRKNLDSTRFSDSSDILGDTIEIDNSTETEINKDLTIENLSNMITKKLKENNSSIISEIQSTIQKEINKAISKLKEDIKYDINYLNSQNIERQTELEQINSKILKLEEENQSLKREINETLNRFSTPQTEQIYESDSKKFVIYGLQEYYQETEYDLDMRLVETFRDTLNLDLYGSIEDTYRVGKYHSRNRPLVVELISKKMVKYIIDNNHYLEGTQLSVAEYLGEKARKERKLLREKMLKARENGLHAVIRNNILYIKGKPVTASDDIYHILKNQNNGGGRDQRNINNSSSHDTNKQTCTKQNNRRDQDPTFRTGKSI